MKIKKNIWILASLTMLMVVFSGCSDWTKIEADDFAKYPLTEPAKSESYYKALRNYKASDHSISFGWYSGWGKPGVSTMNMLSALPDSMDMVSLWNNSLNLPQSKIDDLHFAQQKKGLKVLICTFLQHVGKGFTPPEYDVDETTREAFWGWVENDDIAIRASLVKYAQAIADTINFYGYDGLDVDFEPNVDGVQGKLDENTIYVAWMFEELSKHLGPQSTSGKIFAVDGELTSLPASTGPYFDYYISQAYSVSSGTPSPDAGQRETIMDSRLEQVIRRFTGVVSEEYITKRFIVTENMESALDALNGGFFWTLRNGIRQDKSVCPSLVGMAGWQPLNGFRKGGFGGYRFDAEAANKPSYKWMRRSIQMANPAVN